MVKTRKKRIHTIESLGEIAKLYTHRRQFAIQDAGAYRTAIRMSCLDLICAHMVKKKKFTYSDQEIINKLKKYTSLTELVRENKALYCLATTRKIQLPPRTNRRFTDNDLTQLALTYTSLGAFKKNDNSAYNLCRDRGLIPRLKFETK